MKESKKELFLMQMFAGMPAHVYLKDINGVYLECSDLQAQNLGYKNGKDIVGKTDYDLITKDEADIIRAIDIKVMETEEISVIEETVRLPKTGLTTFQSRKIPLFDDKRNAIGLLGISFDITKEKQLGKSLLETNAKLANVEQDAAKYLAIVNKEITGSEISADLSISELTQNIKDYYEQLIALLPGHVYWMDRNNVFLGCNDLQAKHAGLASRYEIVGKTNYDMPWKEQAAKLNDLNNKVMATGIAYMEEEFAKMTYDEACFLSNKIPLFDKSGNVIGLLGISFDITKRKLLEKLGKEKEKALADQKIQYLRALGGLIAHELRTPLGAIALNYDLIEMAFTRVVENVMAKDSKLYEEAVADNFAEALRCGDQINTVIKKAANTINLLLSNMKEEAIDVSNFMRSSINSDMRAVLANYPFVTDELRLVHYLGAGQDFVYLGNPILTQLIITNLFKNAMYHIKLESKGEIYISLKFGKKKNLLIFHDTGPGIPEKLLPKIFERFVTGRPGGTGLGLAFCKMVMEAYGGDIVCDSKEGEYTTFTLTFPA